MSYSKSSTRERGVTQNPAPEREELLKIQHQRERDKEREQERAEKEREGWVRVAG